MKLTFLSFLITLSHLLYAQCLNDTINGDFIPQNNTFLSGTYIINGSFIVNSNVTVYVQPYQLGGCGKLEIIANNIIINGTINADFAGYPGGNGGSGGTLVTSSTGDEIALNGCSDKDNTGQVIVEGGKKGYNGLGHGGGLAGNDGNSGSGPKQVCLSSSDESGMIGSGAGAGAGAGGSYGGKGKSGGKGGNGNDYYLATAVNVSTGYIVEGGIAGNGGTTLNTYGTPDGFDVDLGSGGAGAGGGGRAYNNGFDGYKGGNGGGAVILKSLHKLIIDGKISTNGNNGGNGGNGSDGGVTEKCCSDGCDDIGELTLSCGAGSGGGAGGGSGGCIYLESNDTTLITGTLESKGGNGGNGGVKGVGVSVTYDANVFCGDDQELSSGDGFEGKQGGAGGGGRIKIFINNTCPQNVINPIINKEGGLSNNSSADSGTVRIVYNPCDITSNEYNIEEYIKIYPNPFVNQLTIESIHHSRLKIINMLGQTIKEIQIAEELININTENWPLGFYQLILSDNNSRIIKSIKVIK